MRTVIAFLLLANVAFFYWSQYVDRPLQRQPAPDVGGMTIVERDGGSVSTAAPVAAHADPDPESLAPGRAAAAGDAALEPVAHERAEPDPLVREPDSTRNLTVQAPKQEPAPAASEPQVAPVTTVTVEDTAEAVVSDVDTGIPRLGLPDFSTPASPGSMEMPPAPAPEAAATKSPGPVDATPDANGPGRTAPAATVAETPTTAATSPAPGPEDAAQADATEAPQVAEAEADTASNGEPAAAGSPPADSAWTCRRFGPLPDDAGEILLSALPAGVTVVSDASEEYSRDGGFFVMIPPLPNREEAQAMLQRLSAAGITDTWLFRAGDYVNGISLGLFSRETTAQRHADDLAARGFYSEVRRRQVSDTGRFVTLRLPAGIAFRQDASDVGEGVAVACP